VRYSIRFSLKAKSKSNVNGENDMRAANYFKGDSINSNRLAPEPSVGLSIYLVVEN